MEKDEESEQPARVAATSPDIFPPSQPRPLISPRRRQQNYSPDVTQQPPRRRDSPEVADIDSLNAHRRIKMRKNGVVKKFAELEPNERNCEEEVDDSLSSTLVEAVSPSLFVLQENQDHSVEILSVDESYNGVEEDAAQDDIQPTRRRRLSSPDIVQQTEHINRNRGRKNGKGAVSPSSRIVAEKKQDSPNSVEIINENIADIEIASESRKNLDDQGQEEANELPPDPIVPAYVKKVPVQQVFSKLNRSLPTFLGRDIRPQTRAALKEELKKIPVLVNMVMSDEGSNTMPPPTKKTKSTKRVTAKPKKRTQEDQEINEEEGKEGVDYPPVLLPVPKRHPKTPSSSSDMSQDITELIPPQTHARKKVRVKKATKKATLASQKESQLSRDEEKEESNGAGIEAELVLIVDPIIEEPAATFVSVSTKNVVLTPASSAPEDDDTNGMSISSGPGESGNVAKNIETEAAALGSVKGILKPGTDFSYKKKLADDIDQISSAKKIRFDPSVTRGMTPEVEDSMLAKTMHFDQTFAHQSVSSYGPAPRQLRRRANIIPEKTPPSPSSWMSTDDFSGRNRKINGSPYPISKSNPRKRQQPRATWTLTFPKDDLPSNAKTGMNVSNVTQVILHENDPPIPPIDRLRIYGEVSSSKQTQSKNLNGFLDEVYGVEPFEDSVKIDDNDIDDPADQYVTSQFSSQADKILAYHSTSLGKCDDKISIKVLQELSTTASALTLRQVLDSQGITTIGQLVGLSVAEAEKLPIHSPSKSKAQHFANVLENFEKAKKIRESQEQRNVLAHSDSELLSPPQRNHQLSGSRSLPVSDTELERQKNVKLYSNKNNPVGFLRSCDNLHVNQAHAQGLDLSDVNSARPRNSSQPSTSSRPLEYVNNESFNSVGNTFLGNMSMGSDDSSAEPTKGQYFNSKLENIITNIKNVQEELSHRLNENEGNQGEFVFKVGRTPENWLKMIEEFPDEVLRSFGKQDCFKLIQAMLKKFDT